MCIRDRGKSVYEVITMASIVEKEAKVDEDRPIIAGVFYNRLNLSTPMNLESCATIQFILGEPKEVLTYSDLNIDKMCIRDSSGSTGQLCYSRRFYSG